MRPDTQWIFYSVMRYKNKRKCKSDMQLERETSIHGIAFGRKLK